MATMVDEPYVNHVPTVGPLFSFFPLPSRSNLFYKPWFEDRPCLMMRELI